MAIAQFRIIQSYHFR